MQAIEATAPIPPIMPTTPARMTHDCIRNGTTSPFAAFDLGSGSVITQHHRRHRHREFVKFLRTTDKGGARRSVPAPVETAYAAVDI